MYYRIAYIYKCFIISFSAVCALVGCVLMGPRIGRFDKKGRPVPMPGHSVPLSALGGLILIFGFFACNGTKQVSNSLLIYIFYIWYRYIANSVQVQIFAHSLLKIGWSNFFVLFVLLKDSCVTYHICSCVCAILNFF